MSERVSRTIAVCRGSRARFGLIQRRGRVVDGGWPVDTRSRAGPGLGVCIEDDRVKRESQPTFVVDDRSSAIDLSHEFQSVNQSGGLTSYMIDWSTCDGVAWTGFSSSSTTTTTTAAAWAIATNRVGPAVYVTL